MADCVGVPDCSLGTYYVLFSFSSTAGGILRSGALVGGAAI